MAKLKSKALLLFKIESVYGTDPTPTHTANALRVEDIKFEVVGSTKERTSLVPSHGKIAGVNVGEALKISFKTELKASGSAGTAPFIAALLKACGMTETVDAGIEVRYALNSTLDSVSSVTFYYYQDGIRHIITGARGTFKVSFKVGELAMIEFDFTGLYASGHETDTAFPTVADIVYDSVAPNIVGYTSSGFSINSYAGMISQFDLDLGNQINKRSDINSTTGIKSYIITQREVKGSIDPEVDALSSFDPFDLFNDTTSVPIDILIGSGTGKNIRIDIPYAVLDVPSYANRENLLTYNIPFKCLNTLVAGDSEIDIHFL